MSVPVDISSEISFKTARSGGKGGQNVNKVETMVEGYFDINRSSVLTDAQKATLHQKLKNRINAEGLFYMRSQEHRSQLSNKQEVVRKMQDAVAAALKKEKRRIATKPSPASKAKRLDSKKKTSEHKMNRKKLRYDEY